MKLKETIPNLLKVSLILLVTLLNAQVMAAPSAADDGEGYGQFDDTDTIDADDSASEDEEESSDNPDIDND